MEQLETFISEIRQDKYKFQTTTNYKTKQDFKKSYDKKLKELKDYCRFQKLNYEEIKEKI